MGRVSAEEASFMLAYTVLGSALIVWVRELPQPAQLLISSTAGGFAFQVWPFSGLAGVVPCCYDSILCPS